MYEFEDAGARQDERLATGLGWFSIGLGLAELAAPDRLAQLIGAPDDDDTRAVLRACGARELANGVAILADPDGASWMWGRVAGDAMDLALLGTVAASDRGRSGRALGAAAAVLGVTALDVVCAGRLTKRSAVASAARQEGFQVERVTTVNRAIEEVYRFWRDIERFPRFMRHLESVEVIGDRRSRWRARGPAGMTVEWEAELIEDRENEWLAWRSVPGSLVQNSGSVRFERAPGARGTEVRVQLEYRPPAGTLGRGVAWLFGESPEQQVHEDLHRFKQLMETGEIPLSDGPGLWRPAQPAADPRELKQRAGVQA